MRLLGIALWTGLVSALAGATAMGQDEAPPAAPVAPQEPQVSAAAVATAPQPLAGGSARKAPGRPFRMGFRPLDPVADATKPLATLDPAGFVVNSGLLIGAINDAWVAGISLTTSRTQWFLEGKPGLTAPPGSFGSSVVLGYRDGRVVKIDALTGKKQWTASLDSFTERPFLLNGTMLYALTAAQVLYALDFQTGKTMWLYDGGFPDGLTIRGGTKPIVHDNKVIFGLSTGEVLAVSADAGKLLWRYNPAYTDARFHDVVGELVVRNNKLLLARYDGLVAAIDLAASVRSVAWQEQLPGLTTSTFRNGRYFVGGLNGDVYAIDPDDGRRLWRAVTGAPVTTLTAGETTLFVAGAEGRVTALDTASGEVVWHDKLGSSLASPPVVFDDAIYYTTGQKSIYAYRLR